MDQYYRHFRNRKIYRFVTFATIEATEEEAVVYQAMYGDRRYWIRTKTNFFEEVSMKESEFHGSKKYQKTKH